MEACERLRAIPHDALLRAMQHMPQVHSRSEIRMLAVRGDNAEMSVTDADLVALCLTARNTRIRPEHVCLDLSDQPVTCVGVETIAAVLQSGCFIRGLRLSGTYISDRGLATLGSSLSNSLLTELDLSHCRISDSGVHFFVRALIRHGTPHRLEALLLGGNPLTGEGITDLISLLESDHCPPSLASMSALPGPASNSKVSEEVETALRVVCELRGVAFVETRPSSSIVINSLRKGKLQSRDECNNRSGASFLVQSLQIDDDPLSDADSCAHHLGKGMQNVADHAGRMESPMASDDEYAATTRHPSRQRAQHNGWGRQFPTTPSGFSGRTTPSGIQTPPPDDAGDAARGSPHRRYGKHEDQTPPRRKTKDSEHLAAWMTEIERELTDLKGLLSANVARLDAQHKQKASELRELTQRLDAWERLQDVPKESSSQVNILNQVEKLEKSIGQGKSECLGMWRLILAALGEEAPTQAAALETQATENQLSAISTEQHQTAEHEAKTGSLMTLSAQNSKTASQAARTHHQTAEQDSKIQTLVPPSAQVGKTASQAARMHSNEHSVQQAGKRSGYKPKTQTHNPAPKHLNSRS